MTSFGSLKQIMFIGHVAVFNICLLSANTAHRVQISNDQTKNSQAKRWIFNSIWGFEGVVASLEYHIKQNENKLLILSNFICVLDV